MGKWTATGVFVCCLIALAYCWINGNIGIVLFSFASAATGALAWDEWRK